MTTWWLTLGDFEDTCGRVVELTFDGMQATTREVLQYQPKADRAVFGKGFTSGCVVDDVAYICGFNEVYRISTHDFKVEALLSRDDFNDLHHVSAHDGQLWIANTGLDRVDVFSSSRQYLGGYALIPSQEERNRALAALPDDPYFAQERVDRPVHLRRLPDRIHPNHIAFFGGRVLVTRFAEKSIQDLGTMRTVLETPGHPHDGFVDGDTLWMTCTNGLIIACQWSPCGSRLEERRRINTFALTGRWGWCRGLWVGEDRLLVGLTRISRMPRHRWCQRPFEGTQTTVLMLRKATGELLAEANLNAFGQHPKLFSILEVSR